MLNNFSLHVLYGFHFFNNQTSEADTIMFETSGFHESNNWYELSILWLALTCINDIWLWAKQMWTMCMLTEEQGAWDGGLYRSWQSHELSSQ